MTDMSARYPAIRFIDCAQLTPEPWKNGGGTTLTLAHGDGSAGAPAWRVSIATLNGPAKFSLFPGLDRTLVPIDTDTVDLHTPHGVLTARAAEPARFKGDLPVSVDLPARPVRVLNVMSRHGVHRSHATVASHSLQVTPAPTHLLVCIDGEWSVGSALLKAIALRPMHGLWIDGRSEELDLRPVSPRARIVSIAIEPATHANVE